MSHNQTKLTVYGCTCNNVPAWTDKLYSLFTLESALYLHSRPKPDILSFPYDKLVCNVNIYWSICSLGIFNCSVTLNLFYGYLWSDVNENGFLHTKKRQNYSKYRFQLFLFQLQLCSLYLQILFNTIYKYINLQLQNCIKKLD